MEATVATVKRLGILGNTGLLGIKRGRDWKKNSYAVMYVQTLERQELTDHNLKKLAFGTGQISGCNIPPAWTEQILEVDQFAFVKLFEQPG